ncbi:MAG TPA: MFS transporter [Steroidobacteraceae bacterium]|nr:MFS transporter [Steroidobacteraceae bacterium]
MADYSEFKEGWRVVLASLVGIGLGLSPVPFYTIGMFAPELAKAFHWQFAQIMFGLTVTTFTVLLSAPAAGFLADRLGVRKVVLGSIVLFGFTFAAFAATDGSLPLFYATWAVLAAGGSGTLPLTWTRAVNNWFETRKGLALGLSLLGTGLFGSLIKPICAWLIAHAGWRAAYLVIGMMPIAIALPIAWFFFHDTGASAGRGPRAALPPLPASGLTFLAALSEWRLWVLAVAFIPISFAVGGPIPNMENILRLRGFDKPAIASLVAFIGLSVVTGRLLGGWLIDRLWAPGVAFVLLSLPAIACWLLLQSSLGYGQALLCIYLIGFAAGVEYDLMAFLVARYFGMRSYASIYGALYGCFALGAGIGPMLFGADFDRSGSYERSLVASAIMLVASAALLLTLGRYKRFAAEAKAVPAQPASTISSSVPSGAHSVPARRPP